MTLRRTGPEGGGHDTLPWPQDTQHLPSGEGTVTGRSARCAGGTGAGRLLLWAARVEWCEEHPGGYAVDATSSPPRYDN